MLITHGAPGEVRHQAKSPFARYELTCRHLVMFTMRFVTYRKQLISYYATNSWKTTPYRVYRKPIRFRPCHSIDRNFWLLNGIGQAYHWFNFLVGLHYCTIMRHCHESYFNIMQICGKVIRSHRCILDRLAH